MRDKLESIIERYNSIQDQMAESEIISNPDKLKDLAKEYKQLEPVVVTGKEYIKILDQIIDCEAMINSDDDDLKELAIEELTESKNRKLIILGALPVNYLQVKFCIFQHRRILS